MRVVCPLCATPRRNEAAKGVGSKALFLRHIIECNDKKFKSGIFDLFFQVDAVFNLELPSNAPHYAHRAGRTGRMGAAGTVISVVTPQERFVVERLSNKLEVPILVRLGKAGRRVGGQGKAKGKGL